MNVLLAAIEEQFRWVYKLAFAIFQMQSSRIPYGTGICSTPISSNEDAPQLALDAADRFLEWLPFAVFDRRARVIRIPGHLTLYVGHAPAEVDLHGLVGPIGTYCAFEEAYPPLVYATAAMRKYLASVRAFAPSQSGKETLHSIVQIDQNTLLSDHAR